MNENGGKSSTILLTVIGIATLLVVVVGATFAYFAAQVNGNDTATSVTIQTASDGTSVAIGGTDAVDLTGIYPRDKEWVNKEVTLGIGAVSGSTTVSDFSFDLVVSKNTYAADDLSFTFVNTEKSDNVTFTKAGTDKTNIATTTEGTTMTNIASGTVARNAATSLKFVLKVYYDETNKNQNNGTEREAVFNVKMNWHD